MENEFEIKEGKRGEFKRLHPSQIEVDHEQNAKIRPWGHSEEHINELKALFLEDGQKEPVIVKKNKGGDKPYKLVTGYGRFLAAQAINDEWGNTPERVFWLKALVEEGNEYDAFLTNLSTNAFNAGLSHMEIAFAIKEMYYYYGKTETEIASKLRKTPSYVSQHKNLLNLNHELQKQVHTGELTFSAALLIAQRPEKEQVSVAESSKDESGKVRIEAVKDSIRASAIESKVEKAIAKGTVPPRSDSQTEEEYREEVKQMLQEETAKAPASKTMRRSTKQIYEFFEGFIMSGPRGALAQAMLKFIDGEIDTEYCFRVWEENTLTRDEFMAYSKYKYNKIKGLEEVA